MATADRADRSSRASPHPPRQAAPQLEPLTIPPLSDAATRSPNRDTALSLSLPLDYYFASPGSGGPTSLSVSGSNSASFSGASDYSQAGGISRSNTYDLSPTYGVGGVVEDEIRALEMHLREQQPGGGNLRRQQETWLNDDEPLVVPPVSYGRGAGQTDASSKHQESINNSLSSSPVSEYSSHFSSAVPSSDMHTIEPHELSDEGFTPNHGRRLSQSHRAVNHRRIHVLDMSSSESSLDLSLHADSAPDHSLTASPVMSSSKETDWRPLDFVDGIEADGDTVRREAFANRDRASASSSVGSGITSRPTSSATCVGGLEPSVTRSSSSRRNKVPGTHPRLAFVAPSDLSSRSLEDLQRRLSATDEESGNWRSAGGHSPERSRPNDGNNSAPAYKTTFRLDSTPSDRSKHLSDLGMATNLHPSASPGTVSQNRTPTTGDGVFHTQRLPGSSPAAAHITTPRQSDVHRMEVTPRGPQPGDKQMTGYQISLSPTTASRIDLRDSVISEDSEGGNPLMGLGFGESVSRQGRGLSPDPPPRSRLRRSSTALDNMAGYLQPDYDATSSSSSLSLEGVPGRSRASSSSSRPASPTRSNSSQIDLAVPVSDTTMPPVRGSSMLASRAVAMSPSYTSLANMTPSDNSASNPSGRPSGVAIPLQREPTFSPAPENYVVSKSSSPGIHRLSLGNIRRPASLLSMRSSSSSVLRSSHMSSFSSAQARPWPAAMVLGHVKSMKNPGDRAREYAKATNSLLSTNSGMMEWYTMVKARAQHPEHGGRARQRSKMTAVNLLGAGASPSGPHVREVSAQSMQSDASFPMRTDATMATEIDHREIDPLNPPNALPPLPYPQLQLVASTGMKASASSQSVKSLGSAFSGGLFAALGRRGSGKKEKQDTSPRRIGFPIAQQGAAPTSAMKRSLDLGQGRQTGVPPPTGPRDRQGASLGPMIRSSDSSYSTRGSLDGRLPAQGLSTTNGLRKQSAPASSRTPRVRDMRGDELKYMQEVLPNANPDVLQIYLERYSGQMEAIGAYLEDEKSNRVSLGAR